VDFIKRIILAISQFFNKKSIAGISGISILKNETLIWRSSPDRVMQLKGAMYYEGVQDILKRKRTIIGEGGELQEVNNLPNNRIIDNQYAKLVNQKANYLLGQPFVVSSDNKDYLECLKQVFNKKFMRNIKDKNRKNANMSFVKLPPFINCWFSCPSIATIVGIGIINMAGANTTALIRLANLLPPSRLARHSIDVA